eukprot:scaffold34937_cov165-Amphora_coffeaeformis.AAC.4
MSSSGGNVDDSHFDGLSSLVRLTGVSVPARARFVGESLLGSTITSLSVGLLSGSVGATFFAASVGPLVPFLIGSGAGYTFGLIYQWRMAKRRALVFCQDYPRLMAHTLRWEWDVRDIPQNANGNELTAWVLRGGLPRLTNLILASHSCASAVEEIKERNRQRIVESYIEGEEET